MIRPYMVGPNGEKPDYTHLRSNDDFDKALDELIQQAHSRYQAAIEYVTDMR
jgi:hypothetical protein